MFSIVLTCCIQISSQKIFSQGVYASPMKFQQNAHQMDKRYTNCGTSVKGDVVMCDDNELSNSNLNNGGVHGDRAAVLEMVNRHRACLLFFLFGFIY